MQPAVSALVLLGFSFHARYARGLIREIKLAELLSEKMRAKSQRGIVLRSRMLHAKVCYSVFKSNGLVDLRSEIMINVAVETHRLGADSFVVEHSRRLQLCATSVKESKNAAARESKDLFIDLFKMLKYLLSWITVETF